MKLSDDVTETIALRRNKSLTTLVSEEIERLIVTGEMKPGDRINEQRLADHLNVNRSVLREARSGLIRSGLLKSVPNKGVFVRIVSNEELHENSEIREVISGFICQRAAIKATNDDKEQLRHLISQMNEAAVTKDSPRFDNCNTQFHKILIEIADHKAAGNFYQDLIRQSHLARRAVLTKQGQLEASNIEHSAIVDAIIEFDSQRAREAGERHVRNGRRRWIDSIQNP
jgi:DNA-binding GntR family transcriptional regulator